MRAILLAAVVLFLGITTAQAQQLFRWVDKDGRVHYTQHPPPADAKDVQRRTLSSGRPETPELPYATQLAARNFPVTLFTSGDCQAACRDARASLQQRGIPFEEVVVGDERTVEELKRVAGSLQVPVLRVGKQVAVGFETSAWKTALDAAGYPESGPPIAGRVREEQKKPLPAVRLYVRADCGNLCDEAKSLLAARKVQFQEIDAGSPETAEELTKVSGSVVVPVLVVGDRVQRGYDARYFNTLLDSAGFPRAPAAAPPQ